MNNRCGGLPLLPELLRFCVSATILQRNSATADPGAKYVWPQALLNCTTLPEVTAWLASEGIENFFPTLVAEGGIAN